MRFQRVLLVIVILAMSALTLAACVRPYPQPETLPVTEEDAVPVMTQPAVLPEQPVATQPAEELLPVATVAPIEPTAVLTPTAEPVQDQIHTVQPGDTLFAIASQYGVTIDSIVTANNIVNVDQLEVGQQILIPAPGSVVVTPTSEAVEAQPTTAAAEQATPVQSQAGGTHVVQPGENLYRIGLRYGCSVEQMATANGIANPARIDVGQVLQVPNCQ